MTKAEGKGFLRARWILILVALLALVAVGCGDDDGDSSSDAEATEEDSLSGEIKVFAAASLTEAYAEVAQEFEKEHPDVTVTFSFAGSSALATQIDQGAPFDVFVSADEPNMKKVTDPRAAGDPKIVARNTLSMIVQKGNPKRIKALRDFDRSGTTYVICAPEVPCGRYGQLALEKAAVTTKPKSLEENVKAVVTKVDLGEADAGIVYVTDVKASLVAGDDVQGVAISGADDPSLVAVYPQAVARSAANPEVAKAWQDFVLSDDGQEILEKFGFLSP